MQPEYTIREKITLLFDSPRNIDFHIRSGDYFSVLATMMGFIEETLAACGAEHENDSSNEKQRAIARELRHDLRYVQANYEIVPRAPEDIQLIRPSGNILLR